MPGILCTIATLHSDMNGVHCHYFIFDLLAYKFYLSLTKLTTKPATWAGLNFRGDKISWARLICCNSLSVQIFVGLIFVRVTCPKNISVQQKFLHFTATSLLYTVLYNKICCSLKPTTSIIEKMFQEGKLSKAVGPQLTSMNRYSACTSSSCMCSNRFQTCSDQVGNSSVHSHGQA